MKDLLAWLAYLGSAFALLWVGWFVFTATQLIYGLSETWATLAGFVAAAAVGMVIVNFLTRERR